MGFPMLACVAITLAADPPGDDPVKEGLKALQGEWRVRSVESEGRERDLPALAMPKDLTFIFDAKGHMKMISESINYGPGVQVTIDPTKSPAHIDIPWRGGTSRGLYHLDGEWLSIYVDQSGRAPRPGEMVTTPGSVALIFLLKKAE